MNPFKFATAESRNTLSSPLAVTESRLTQWDLVEAVATSLVPNFTELIRQAEQGEVLHNNDTRVKILELLRRNWSLADPGEDVDNADRRTGLFTTGVVALSDGHRVALFFSGSQHAGENLADVLRHHPAELPPPIQMCDALSRNLPDELQTIVAHCLVHARQQFVDVYDHFPEQGRHLLESLAVVYRNEVMVKEKGLSPEARLKFHQQESGPTIRQLHEWLKRQLDEMLAEPNSGLGGAIRYTLKHWEKLWLRHAGTPLDGDRRRIGTQNGARVGDLFMSLIYTCQLNETNPFEYLNELQNHIDQFAANPSLWMPWNYRETLA